MVGGFVFLYLILTGHVTMINDVNSLLCKMREFGQII